MFENVDGRTTDAGVTGILIAHLGAFGSGERKTKNPHNQWKAHQTTDQQQQKNHRLKTDISLSNRGGGGGGGLNAFYWYQIFAQDSVVVKAQNCLVRIEVS